MKKFLAVGVALALGLPIFALAQVQCPSGQDWNADTETCETSASPSDCVGYPPSYVWNASFGTCISPAVNSASHNCAGSTVWSDILSGCVSPAANSTAHGCANGTVWSDSFDDCVSPAVHAATSPGGGGFGGGSGGLDTTRLQGYSDSVITFTNFTLVPLLIAIAFIVFLWGIYNYFIWGANSEDKRKEGKNFVFYAVIGFVIIFSLWGIIHVGVDIFNLGGETHPTYPTL